MARGGQRPEGGHRLGAGSADDLEHPQALGSGGHEQLRASDGDVLNVAEPVDDGALAC